LASNGFEEGKNKELGTAHIEHHRRKPMFDLCPGCGNLGATI
jgi:hypothetical protein